MSKDDSRRPWELVITRTAYEAIKQIQKGSAKRDLHNQLKEKLEPDPYAIDIDLRKPLAPCRRVRLGKFRVIYLPRRETRKILWILDTHKLAD